MQVNLDRQDLLNLVESSPPSYAQQRTDEMLELGRYSQAFDRWIWSDELKEMNDEELFELYKLCKK